MNVLKPMLYIVQSQIRCGRY